MYASSSFMFLFPVHCLASTPNYPSPPLISDRRLRNIILDMELVLCTVAFLTQAFEVTKNILVVSPISLPCLLALAYLASAPFAFALAYTLYRDLIEILHYYTSEFHSIYPHAKMHMMGHMCWTCATIERIC